MKKNNRSSKIPIFKSDVRFLRNLSIFALVIKILIVVQISKLNQWTNQGHMWLGADGENYLLGASYLSDEGLFSKRDILNYWPAGYPILIYFFGIFGKAQSLTFLGIFQSLVFSFSVFSFTKEIAITGLKKLSRVLCLLLLINPTLSLNSLSVGYESLAASGYLMILALVLYLYRVQDQRKRILIYQVIAATLSFISFLQPRFIPSGILIGLILIMTRKELIKSFAILLIFMMILFSLPAALVLRNHVSTGVNVVSLNLGVTMNIGAGEDASGTYRGSWKGVPCKYNESNRVEADSAQTKCVLRWYTNNPGQALRLFWNKTKFFWSPWIGPTSTGTMARNPWNLINPLNDIAKNPEGFNLIYGKFGKLVSWSWALASVLLMLLGLRKLFFLRAQFTRLSIVCTAIVFPSWLISLLTLGDNRFRLPILGVVIFLELLGLFSLFTKKALK